MNPIVATAREYIGTPFHHQGRVKGVGVDCVGLVLCVARELGHVPPGFDVPGYVRHPDGVELVRHLNERMTAVDKGDMRPGDVVLVRFTKYPQHVGILGNYRHGGLSIIHADGLRGKVLETRLMFTDAMQFVAAYRFPEAVNG